ncbi:MAG: DUF4157 domain-containing protein [Burkholderiales bacterium]|nr:DUF4157 domain-containing protein [Burkholderiales bacterium]
MAEGLFSAKSGAGRKPALLQRACACGGPSATTCPACARKKKLQRSTSGPAGSPTPMLGGASALTRGGTALPATLRGSLGPLFGSDFSQVRIHDDAASHEAARQTRARAFTVGQHVHFGAGQFRPGNESGRRLIAHELGHTLQQQGAGGGSEDELAIDAADSPLEREADAAADAVLQGRVARVQRAAAALPQAKLLQRDGLGSAGGGSETETVERPVDDNTTVQIRRTITEARCDYEPHTQQTPSDKIFSHDAQTHELKMDYVVCRGKVQLGTKGEVSYDKVYQSATNLLNTLQNNPALGQNLNQLVDNQLQQATVTASGDITLTVDGILQASVQGTTTQGTGGQKYKVQGVLKVTPKGVSFAVTGGIDVAKTPLQSATTYSLEGKAATKYFAVTLRYEQIDTSRVGGAPSSKGQFVGGLDVPITDTVTLGPTVTVGPDGKPVFGGGIKGSFGGPDKAPKVSCYACHCPLAKPEYACTRKVKEHSTPEVKEPEKHSLVKLFYDYNSTKPQQPKEFEASVGSVASLLGQGWKVEHIWGYASPEGSLDAPKPPVPGFKGNQALSQRRADDARARIAQKAKAATLPEAEGRGEQLGDLDGSGDSADRDLTPQLVKLLEPKGDEERLDALGVDEAVRADPVRRAKALADIQAFVSGREAGGLALGQRPRWEKVFPLLRRVEVALKKDKVVENVNVPADSKKADCEAADTAYADQNMKPIPAERRIPPKDCRPD